MRDFNRDPIRESITIHAPIARCFALSTRVELVKETLGMTLVADPAPGYIASGHIVAHSRVHWQGWKFGLPTHHHTLITSYADPHPAHLPELHSEYEHQPVAWFQDSQAQGRFATFHHDHYFRESPRPRHRPAPHHPRRRDPLLPPLRPPRRSRQHLPPRPPHHPPGPPALRPHQIPRRRRRLARLGLPLSPTRSALQRLRLRSAILQHHPATAAHMRQRLRTTRKLERPPVRALVERRLPPPQPSTHTTPRSPPAVRLHACSSAHPPYRRDAHTPH